MNFLLTALAAFVGFYVPLAIGSLILYIKVISVKKRVERSLSE